MACLIGFGFACLGRLILLVFCDNKQALHQSPAHGVNSWQLIYLSAYCTISRKEYREVSIKYYVYR